MGPQRIVGVVADVGDEHTLILHRTKLVNLSRVVTDDN